MLSQNTNSQVVNYDACFTKSLFFIVLAITDKIERSCYWRKAPARPPPLQLVFFTLSRSILFATGGFHSFTCQRFLVWFSMQLHPFEVIELLFQFLFIIHVCYSVFNLGFNTNDTNILLQVCLFSAVW